MKFPSENVSIKGKLDCMHLRDTMYYPDKDGIHQNIPRSDMNLTLPLRPWQWSAMQQCTSYVALHRRPPHTDTPTDSHTNNISILVAVLHTCTSWITMSMDPPRHGVTPGAQSALLLHCRLGRSGRNLCTSGEQAEMQWAHAHYHQMILWCVALTRYYVGVTQKAEQSVFSFGALLRRPFQGPSISWTSGRMDGWAGASENWPFGWHGKGWIKFLIRHINLSAYIHDRPLLSICRNSIFDIHLWHRFGFHWIFA
jgi:hypothetical protein